MPIKHSKKTNQLPLTPPDILLHKKPIFLPRPEPNINPRTTVKPGHLESQVSKLYLRVEGKGELFGLFYLSEHFLVGD